MKGGTKTRNEVMIVDPTRIQPSRAVKLSARLREEFKKQEREEKKQSAQLKKQMKVKVAALVDELADLFGTMNVKKKETNVEDLFSGLSISNAKGKSKRKLKKLRKSKRTKRVKRVKRNRKVLKSKKIKNIKH